ncbi:MAG TPA: hypothetical protein ENJ87_06865, partial [Gammaproteobacteria bacterium]|nr:hypothetical protein [Gammaproteobacteria bacterium]
MFGNIYKKNSLDKWLILLTASVLVAYPVARFVVVEVRSAYLVLLFLFSLVVLGFRFSQVKKIELSHIEKLLLSSFFLMFAVTLLSAIVLGGDGLEQKRVGAYLGFLLAIPVYLLFRLYMPSDRVIWSSIVVSCYVVV